MLNKTLLFAATALGLTALSGGAADKANVLFLFADDQCYKTLGSLNNAEIKTPNLDRLAARGTAFTRAYNMGGYHGAICVASRTMLVTGQHLWHARANEKAMKTAFDGEFWPQLMADAGYSTYFTGKWHVQADAKHLFQTARHIRGGMPKQTPEGYNRPLADGTDPWDPSDPKFGGFWEGGKHWSEVVADDAIDFLDDAEEGEKPFFMYIAFNAPHDPRQAPKEFVDMYPAEQIELPPSFLPEYPWKDAIGCGKGLRDEKLAPFPRTAHAVRVNRREYYAIISHMDQQIGRILDHLESTGQAENTYIFFTADHGLSVGHHGLIGKQSLFEHSTRVPFLAAGPGIAAGATNGAPIYLQSAMATSLEIAGAKRPERVQFASLLPTLKGGGDGGTLPAVYGAYVDVQRSVTKGKHKLLLFPKIAKAQLFDLEADPEEMRDLSGEAGSLEVMKALYGELVKLQEEAGDRLDLAGTYPVLAGR